MIPNLKKKIALKNQILILAYLTLLVSFKSSNQWSTLPIGNDLFWWIIQIVFVFLLIRLKFFFKSPSIEHDFLFVKIYLFWNIICIARGVNVSENYWEWKNLIATTFLLLLPIISYLAVSVSAIQVIIKTWFKYGLFMFVLISPFLWGDAVGKFLIPTSFLLLFLPILTTRWKILILSISIFSIFFDLTARANVIKFFVPFLIGFLYYSRNSFIIKSFNIMRLVMLSLPFLLLFLGSTNNFNIFKINDYFEGSKNLKIYDGISNVKEKSLIDDTRSFLYYEVLESAIKNNYIIFGRTPARGNDSKTFGNYNKFKLGTGKQERFSNEVSILNIFTWLGFVGVALYFLVFIKASYLAINQSNNIFIKLVGLNICFRWVFGFIEDFSQFDLSNIFLWIMIGMCFSKSFRNMTDNQMQNWIRGIFRNKGEQQLSLNNSFE